MRENCTPGSEGGDGASRSLPLSKAGYAQQVVGSLGPDGRLNFLSAYPEASNIVVFVIMALVLLVRPAGLFGRD